MRVSFAGIRRASVNFSSRTSAQLYKSDELGSSQMLIVKVPAAVAAVLFMSVSAQAMEFAKPAPVSETFAWAPTVRAVQSDERLRRQINTHNIVHPVSVEWMKLDRPRPISNLKRVWTVQRTVQNRPGRLSAEFSALARSSRIKFEYGPGEISGWLKPPRIAMKFAHRPGPIGNLFPPMADVDVTLADRAFTSSIVKVIIRPGMRPRPSSAGICIGSMAPCGVLSFAGPARIGSLSSAYIDKRL
jgi:hypothetical protein